MSTPCAPTVLIDATPLRTPSGVRGIGRYVFELLHGLHDERPVWKERLRIVALGSLGARGEVELSEDLAGTADRAIEQRGAIPNQTMRRRRQLWLGAAASKAGASLLHETEALGTPLYCPTPRLVTCYDLIPLHYPTHYLPTPAHFPLQWLKDWRRYARARRVVTISERTRDDVLRILKIPAGRVQAVLTGIDLQRWSNQPSDGDAGHLEALGLRPRSFLIYVGYGDFRKNAEGMFATLALARQRADVSLVWAGVLSKKLLAALTKKAKRAGVLEHVKFAGFVSDEALGALYRGSIAHLFLSRLEGFGLSVAEAMAVGCPVIVARASGADEVAGEAGFVVNPEDSRAAAEAVLALRDEAARTRAGEASRARVALFGRGVMARGYVEEYLRALEVARN
jgi:glycosyltransferase involved in cell wall biosynthesis